MTGQAHREIARQSRKVKGEGSEECRGGCLLFTVAAVFTSIPGQVAPEPGHGEARPCSTLEGADIMGPWHSPRVSPLGLIIVNFSPNRKPDTAVSTVMQHDAVHRCGLQVASDTVCWCSGEANIGTPGTL